MGKTDHDTFCTLCPYVPVYSPKMIADGLMEDGICTPSGGEKWYPSTVSIILENEKYAGERPPDAEMVCVTQVYTLTGVSASVAGEMPSDAGSLTYAKGTESKTGSVTVSSWEVDSSGNVTATISGGAAGDTVTLPVIISSTNYADSTVNVVVTLRAKDEVGVTITGISPIAIEYGDTIVISGSVQNLGTNEVWTWNSSDSEVLRITQDGANATIEMMKVGTATITASYVSDTSVGTFTTESITVHPRAITITAKDQNIYVGGTVPDLNAPVQGTHYTVAGLIGSDTLIAGPILAYMDGNDAANPDASMTGSYTFHPHAATAGDNYTITYVDGTLTISEKQPATVTKAPEAKTLTYNGQARHL